MFDDAGRTMDVAPRAFHLLEDLLSFLVQSLDAPMILPGAATVLQENLREVSATLPRRLFPAAIQKHTKVNNQKCGNLKWQAANRGGEGGFKRYVPRAEIP